MTTQTKDTVTDPQAPVKPGDITPQLALDSFNAAERKIYRRLQKTVVAYIDRDLWWYWDLGKEICAIYKEAQNDSELYGARLLERLAAALMGYKTPRMLYNAMHVVECWDTKASFTVMLKLRGNAENRLTWTHFTYLVRISDAKARLQMAVKTLRFAWTPEELNREINAVLETKPANSTGRTPQIPASVPAALAHITAQSKQFVNKVTNSWVCDRYDVLEKADEIPPDKLDERFVAAVAEARESLQVMQVANQRLQQRLLDIESMIARKEACGPESDSVSMSEHRRQQRKKSAPKKPRKRAGAKR